MGRTAAAGPASAARLLREPRAWLGVYAVALAVIAFWPSPVDRDAGPLLAAVTRAVPWLTYDVIETSANVLLFVPFGLLLALSLPRRPWLAVPVALVVTVAIELGQAVFLAARTASLRDVIANVAGAAIGCLIAVWIAKRRRRPI